MFWTTRQLADAAGLNKAAIWYLMLKNPKVLVPAFEAGRIYFWLPSTLEVVKDLRERLSKRGRPRKVDVMSRKG